MEKTATRADLADVTPVPCAHVGIRDGVASSEELGCQAGDPARSKSEVECKRFRGAEVAQHTLDTDHVARLAWGRGRFTSEAHDERNAGQFC